MGILDQFDLTGQCAIITGAGTGLGREMALHLAEAGADIVGVGRRAEPIEAVGEEIRAKGRRYLGCTGVDVTVSSQVNEMVEQAIREMGRITVLINNAGLGGTGRGKTLPELTDEDWHSGIDSNLSSAFYCSRAVVSHMMEHQGGRIINITSGWGFRGGRNNFMYPIAKGGVIQLTKALAMTYARDGIRASCIAPGLFPKTEERGTLEQLGDKQPAGRVGFLREIGPLAVFLASPAADYLSGETVLIDGGSIAAGITPAGLVPRAEG
ncbi:MAG: oxidoreductase [Chloroflexi bacterium HGW-Chloroflexi-9]|nr:SDR family NAD(P)-dependent oxidoreductase [Dehalococcoidia bacterium]PKN82553.1 MAG: oxidoreductase [Chloroflexi bacterium HGW-Chloroflexi-9]